MHPPRIQGMSQKPYFKRTELERAFINESLKKSQVKGSMKDKQHWSAQLTKAYVHLSIVVWWAFLRRRQWVVEVVARMCEEVLVLVGVSSRMLVRM